MIKNNLHLFKKGGGVSHVHRRTATYLAVPYFVALLRL